MAIETVMATATASDSASELASCSAMATASDSAMATESDSAKDLGNVSASVWAIHRDLSSEA
ncbi:MAG TPA: hypothetical protein VKT72_00290 [Candidatus Baltobacteraceae bacterium]|nr:hypothetical protein [Candidatus Baltobacteraceae bacterium]